MKYIYGNYSNMNSNSIPYYIQYLSTWVYHNVLYTETTVVLLKCITFIILLTLLVYQKYHYFTAGIIIVICVTIYLYTKTIDGVIDAHNGILEWIYSITTTTTARHSVDKDELTNGVSLKEGFSITMPKIVVGDDSGKDYHRSNKFIEDDSRDFTDKYFNSKKCGIGSGIGGISMFGSNELLGGSREVALSGVYNFAAFYVTNDANGNSVNRYKYFKDCVLEPVKRSLNSGDFRDVKQNIYNKINEKIINITTILGRFNTDLLFNTNSNSRDDYSKRISLYNYYDNNDKPIPNYVSIIKVDPSNNNAKQQRYNLRDIDDGLNDKSYSELLTQVNNDKTMNSNVKQKSIEVYSKVYEYRKRISAILANMRTKSKDSENLLYAIRIDESIVQELRVMLGYLAIIKHTNDIISFEKSGGSTSIYKKVSDASLLSSPVLNPFTDINKLDTNNVQYLTNISGVNNIFKIPLEDDTYNTNDEKRYLYGLTYYFDKDNSAPS